jgi:hypothetical protein
MWTPVDITVVPTAQDLIYAKSAIKKVEIELKDALLAPEQAQRRVDRIKQDLWEQRAWIAPVRRLSSDVISLIFEFCGEDNWRTPLRIAGVSRQWRDIALATPRVWAFLDVHECSDAELVGHFFKHSGQRPLHVCLHESQCLTILSDVIKRLECLSIYNNSHMEEYPVFPKLKRFSLGKAGRRIEISDLCTTCFPALHELICAPVIEGNVTSTLRSMKPVLPPLQVLSVTTGWNTVWLDLLISCRSSLESLRLYFEMPFPATSGLVLPMLKCLEIVLWMPNPDGWPIDLKTPLLETYKETRGYPRGLAILLFLDNFGIDAPEPRRPSGGCALCGGAISDLIFGLIS